MSSAGATPIYLAVNFSRTAWPGPGSWRAARRARGERDLPRFRLPVGSLGEYTGQTTSRPDELTADRGGVAKILVVDDQPTSRRLLATVLRHAGHSVIQAS